MHGLRGGGSVVFIVSEAMMLQGKTVALADGAAEYMGNGVFVALQQDERGRPQSVALTEADLRAMLAAVVA